MQPESHVLLREFNRRLRAALKDAPNHVRVEATLEVESHVQDVLSRGRGTEPEPEQVACILAGFGTPEEYASALTSQLPEAASATVMSGVKDMLTAGTDLVHGSGRLILAIGRQAFALIESAVRSAVAGARWALPRLVMAADAVRGPLWSARDLVVAGGRHAGVGAAHLAEKARAASAVAFRTGRSARRLGEDCAQFAGRTAGLAGRALRWTFRLLAMAALAVLALISLGVAGFAALAPDIAGFFVHAFQTEVGLFLDAIRAETIARYAPGNPAAYVQTGTAVVAGALTVAIALAGLLGFMLWSARRRRGSLTG